MLPLVERKAIVRPSGDQVGAAVLAREPRAPLPSASSPRPRWSTHEP